MGELSINNNMPYRALGLTIFQTPQFFEVSIGTLLRGLFWLYTLLTPMHRPQ